MKESKRAAVASFAGVLLGTAVGDALGLPAENLPPERIRKWWPGSGTTSGGVAWQMRLLFGRGMISDDTEHRLMVAQALLVHCHDAEAFERALGWKFRWWFAGLPGGVGMATAKACLRLWAGISAVGQASSRRAAGRLCAAVSLVHFSQRMQRGGGNSFWLQRD